jgi:branched-chain amino acid transport system substrate-binding protein
MIDPFSGPTALQGETALRHMQMAIDGVNASESALGGRRIELLPLDNKGNPQEALIALKHAIDRDVRIVMQGVGAHIAHALTEAVAKHNLRNPGRAVLYLNFSAPDPALTNEKCNFWHFRFDSHTDMKIDALTTALARDPGIRRVYLLNQDYSYGQQVARMAREMLTRKRPDIAIVGDELHPLARIKDFAPYVTKIKASGADAVLTGNWGNDLVLLIRAGSDIGLHVGYFTLWAHISGMGQSMRIAGADRVRSVANWFVNGPDDRLEPFYRAYKQRYREEWLYAPSKTAIEMLAQAIRMSATTDSLALARALEDMRFDAGAGEVWMRPDDHQLIQPLYVATLTQAGAPNVRHEFENSGLGWRVDMRIEAHETALPTTCSMQRP